MKQIIILAGPNGAGKTTFAAEFLPNEAAVVNFINADLIAFGLSPFDPESVAIEAARILLYRIDECVSRGVSFGVETTLSGNSYLSKIPIWQQKGYIVKLYFLSLPSADFAVERVRRRVQLGGHSIPKNAILRRFTRGLKNLPKYQAIVDEWQIWDTSSCKPEKIDGNR
jgi:predicted ABC-type ATPase